MARGATDPEIPIEEDDVLARCPRCGRRYRVFTGDLARSADGKRVDAARSSYVLNLAPAERLPQRWRITAPSNCRFERGYRYTLVWYKGRLSGIADQTAGEWVIVPHAPGDDRAWRAAWVGIVALILANLALQIEALRGFLDKGTVYWAGPAVLVVLALVMAGRWLLTEERER